MGRIRTRNVDMYCMALAALDYVEFGPLMHNGGYTVAGYKGRCEGCGLMITRGDTISRVTRRGNNFNRDMWAHRGCVETTFRVHARWLEVYETWMRDTESPWILLYVIDEPTTRKQCNVCHLYGKKLAVVRRFRRGVPYVTTIAECHMTKEGAIKEDVNVA